jgi:hypothetical protein
LLLTEDARSPPSSVNIFGTLRRRQHRQESTYDASWFDLEPSWQRYDALASTPAIAALVVERRDSGTTGSLDVAAARLMPLVIIFAFLVQGPGR